MDRRPQTRTPATRPLAPLGRLTLALLASLLLLPALVLAGGRQVSAQAQPPDRFFGSVKIDGKDQPEGTVVEAYIGNTLCGSGTVTNRNGTVEYIVDVLGAGEKPNCAKDGDKVTFKVAGLDAKETGTYATAAATHLDLTATGTPRQIQQPTVLAPGQGGTPAPAPTFTPPPTQQPAATAPSATAPARAATTAPATTAAGPATAPAGVGSAPAATAGAVAAASPTPPATPSLAAPATPASVRVAPDSGGGSTTLWIVIVLALLALGAGLAIWVYRQGYFHVQ